MEATLQTLSIHQLKEMAPVLNEYGFGDDFFLCEISREKLEKSRAAIHMLHYPVRFDGYLCLFCIRGTFTIDINLNSFQIRPGNMFLNIPGNIINFNLKENDLDSTRLILVALSRDFMSSIRFDFNQVFHESLHMLEHPCVALTEEQVNLAREYLVLTKSILSGPVHYKREIVRGLLSSLVYLMADVWTQAASEARQKEPAPVRVKEVFDRFLSLVTEYHTQQRGLAFYADKLQLTPKYMSKLVKQASGRSAPEWIDSFVILEAKNMLKYSDKSIKQIVFLLHFPNQSVFYKFFKAHTGLTPSQYRNS